MSEVSVAARLQESGAHALELEDVELLSLLEADAALAGRPHGRCIQGEPQAVVELLNAAEDILDLHPETGKDA